MKLGTIVLWASLALVGVAQAHAPAVGANGGRQVNAGPYHVEMLVEGPNMTIFLRDHGDRVVQTAGFRGTAILVVNGRTERVALSPAGDNRLTGSAAEPLPAAPKGVVQVISASGASTQGRFD